jgi:hypothetical protein
VKGGDRGWKESIREVSGRGVVNWYERRDRCEGESTRSSASVRFDRC